MNTWEAWEALRSTEDPDPIEVLKAVSTFQRYFSAVEIEAVRVARAKGNTWEQIGSALGRTKQALWQRISSPKQMSAEEMRQRWEATKRDPDGWWASTVGVHVHVETGR